MSESPRKAWPWRVLQDHPRRRGLAGGLDSGGRGFLAPAPRGTYIGHGASLAEVKAIAERDYELRRQQLR
jgi:hypothetical protein